MSRTIWAAMGRWFLWTAGRLRGWRKGLAAELEGEIVLDEERGAERLAGREGGEIVEAETIEGEIVEASEKSELERLGLKQRTTLEMLAAGKSVAEAAREAGWGGRRFICGSTRREISGGLQQMARGDGRGVAGAVADGGGQGDGSVEKGFAAGDAKTVLQFLKGMGAVRPTSIGEIDAEEMRKTDELVKRGRKVCGKRAEMKLVNEDLLADFGI